MPRYVALLRAVNVGSTGKPMTELNAICVAEGFADVMTDIDGNVVFPAADRYCAA